MSDTAFFFAIGKRVTLDFKVFGDHGVPIDVVQREWSLCDLLSDRWEVMCQINDALLLVGTLAQKSRHGSVCEAGRRLVADLADLEYADQWAKALCSFGVSVSDVSF